MSEVKAAKDALVASLFELSRSASDAASATANLYKVSHNPDDNTVDTLHSLAKAINTLVASVDAPTADVKKPEKKKVERDPNAPKKPLTMYFAYSFHIREQIRDERKATGLPPLSAIEMNAYVKDRWTGLSPAEKAVWQKKYQDELVIYNKLKDEYKAQQAGKPIAPVVAAPPIIAPVLSSSSESSSSEESEVEPEPEKKKKEKKRKHDKEKSEKKKKSKKQN